MPRSSVGRGLLLATVILCAGCASEDESLETVARSTSPLGATASVGPEIDLGEIGYKSRTFGREVGIGCGAGMCLVAWYEGGVTYATRVSTDGTLLDVHRTVLAETEVVPAPIAVSYGAGRFLVVLQDGSALRTFVVRASDRVVLSEGVLSPSPAAPATMAHIAFTGTHWLVVWADARNDPGSADVLGQLVDQDGVADAAGPITIAAGAGRQDHAAVALGAGQLLVAWDGDQTTPQHVYARRYSLTGTPIGGDILISAPWRQRAPRIAFDGSNWLVTYEDYRGSEPPDIFAQRVSDSGGLIGFDEAISQPVATDTRGHSWPDVAFAGSAYLALWGHTFSFPCCSALVQRRIATSGAALGDQAVVPVSSNDSTSYLAPPALGSDGTTFVAAGRALPGNGISVVRYRGSDGVQLDTTPIGVSGASFFSIPQGLRFGGGVYLASWFESRVGSGSGSDLATRFRSDGTVLDPAGIALPNDFDPTAVYSDNRFWGLADNGDLLTLDSRDGALGRIGRLAATGILALSPTELLVADGTRVFFFDLALVSLGPSLPLRGQSALFGTPDYLVAADGAVQRVAPPGHLVGLPTVLASGTLAGRTLMVRTGSQIVVVIGSDGTDGNTPGLRAHRIGLDGTPIGSLVTLSTEPAIAVHALYDGVDLGVVWEDPRDSTVHALGATLDLVTVGMPFAVATGIVRSSTVAAADPVGHDLVVGYRRHLYEAPYAEDRARYRRVLLGANGALDAGMPPDAGSTMDASSDSGTSMDGGPTDSGATTDTGPSDMGASTDTGPSDSATSMDAGSSDSGTSTDAGSSDMSTSMDAGPSDAGTSMDAATGIELGTMLDLGAPFDAGTTTDAGTTLDAGGATDAATIDGAISSDGGASVDARTPDATVSSDAGSLEDAARSDASAISDAAPADAAAVPDGAVGSDGSADAATDGSHPDGARVDAGRMHYDGTCDGCMTAGSRRASSGRSITALLLALAVAVRGRRRRR